VRLRPSGSEVERLFADTTKAQKLIGWKPEYGGLEGFRKGLSESIEWFSTKGNIESYKSNIYNI
jgi:dTDP-glucose 4,6-dehydratase